MRKSFKLEDLCCANCASKIENGVAALDGVESASVNLLSQKMVVEIDESKSQDLFNSIKKIVKKYEPDIDVIEL